MFIFYFFLFHHFLKVFTQSKIFCFNTLLLGLCFILFPKEFISLFVLYITLSDHGCLYFSSFSYQIYEVSYMLYQKHCVKSVLIFQLPHQHHLDSQLYYSIQNQVFHIFYFHQTKFLLIILLKCLSIYMFWYFSIYFCLIWFLFHEY